MTRNGETRLRIVIAPAGSRGDVQPALVLARTLTRRGHSVLMATHPEFGDWIEAHGIEFVACGRNLQAVMRENAAVVGRLWSAVRRFNRLIADDIAEQGEVLTRVAPGAHVVLGASIQFIAGSVAEGLGMPYAHMVYCPQILRSRHHPPALFPWQTLPHWMNALGWRLFVGTYNRLLLPHVNRRRARLGLKPITDLFGKVTESPILLACDAELAPMPPDLPARCRQIPYLADDDPAPLPEGIRSFLATGAAPVFVGFGSMPAADPAGTTRIIVEATRRAKVRVLLSAGWAGLGEGGLPDHCCVVGDVAHGALFQHVRAVVHHGGAGTTATAARAGVPQVVVPHLLDQFYWADRVARLGLGPAPLRVGSLTAERLARALARCLDDRTMISRAREMAAEVQSHRAPEAAADWVEAVANAHGAVSERMRAAMLGAP